MTPEPPPQRSLAAKAMRFPLVGLLSSAIYAVATSLCISQAQMDHGLASLTGYLVALPVSFFGHRNFTFGASGRPTAEFARFIVMHAVGFALAWGAMNMAGRMQLHWGFGVFGAVVLVPAVSFLVLDRWVFRPR